MPLNMPHCFTLLSLVELTLTDEYVLCISQTAESSGAVPAAVAGPPPAGRPAGLPAGPHWPPTETDTGDGANRRPPTDQRHLTAGMYTATTGSDRKDALHRDD